MSETFEQHAAFIILITYDAKVIELWRTPRNGVDPHKLDIAAVKAVRSKYFPETKYENFAPLYRDKARGFPVARSHEGIGRVSYQINECYILLNNLLVLCPHGNEQLESHGLLSRYKGAKFSYFVSGKYLLRTAFTAAISSLFGSTPFLGVHQSSMTFAS
jgi:hypothetical protein